MKLETIYRHYLKHGLIDTDTRRIRKNSLFFALKGENFDGNRFANEALEKGASLAIVDDKKMLTNDRMIVVHDVLETLQALARYHRLKLDIPVIALTGSNGKTTTKELIHAVLSRKYNVIATEGNLNNHIGVPLTLLRMTAKTEMAVIEMGANHLKEIEALCTIAMPNFGYITNFGKAHLEGFGSEAGVIKGKSELYDHLIANDGIAFINGDDSIQVEKTKELESVGYNRSDLPQELSNAYVSVNFKNSVISSQLIGAYNYTNIAAAITIGNYFGVATEQIKSGIENYSPSNNRSQIIEKNGLKIVLDAYNANPTSMAAALKSFSKLQEKSKTVILGDMFELGKVSGQEHQNIAALASALNFTKVYLIGKAFSTVHVKNAFIFENFELFKANFSPDAIVKGALLIKGSRGMALERVLDLL